MGENGAGKSTLMKILSGALSKDSGEIIINGNETEIDSPSDALKFGIGIIYQDFKLVPELSVAENIFLGKEPMQTRFRSSTIRRCQPCTAPVSTARGRA